MAFDLNMGGKGYPEGGPRVVALESSGRQGGVAVGVGGGLRGVKGLPAASRHAIELMPCLADLVVAAGWSAEEIDQVYVGTGPGSFTGLRISIAVARGLVQASGGRVKVVAVPSLEVIAQNAPAEARHVVVALDAKRGQVFAGRLGRGANGSWVTVEEPALVDPQDFVRRAVQAAGGERVFVMGEGVEYHRAALIQEGVVEVEKSLWAARAEEVLRLGWERVQTLGDGAFTAVGDLLPLYIRLPEAEELWRKRQG